MSWFVESPWPAVLFCTLLLLGCGVLFVRTGKVWVIGLMAASVALMAGLVVVEQIIVTDREEVEDTLHGVAENLAANNVPAVLAAFSPKCPGLREAESILNRVTVQTAVVGADLEVNINQLTSPPTALAYFTGRVQARDKHGSIPYENYIRKFKVRLERHGDRWLIADYEDGDPRRKMR
jgi:hypothetical protein